MLVRCSSSPQNTSHGLMLPLKASPGHLARRTDHFCRHQTTAWPRPRGWLKAPTPSTLDLTTCERDILNRSAIPTEFPLGAISMETHVRAAQAPLSCGLNRIFLHTMTLMPRLHIDTLWSEPKRRYMADNFTVSAPKVPNRELV